MVGRFGEFLSSVLGVVLVRSIGPLNSGADNSTIAEKSPTSPSCSVSVFNSPIERIGTTPGMLEGDSPKRLTIPSVLGFKPCESIELRKRCSEHTDNENHKEKLSSELD